MLYKVIVISDRSGVLFDARCKNGDLGRVAAIAAEILAAELTSMGERFTIRASLTVERA